MSARDAILARVREAADGAVPHPGAYTSPGGPRDWDTFAERLRSVGGEPYGPFASGALKPELARLCRSWSPMGRIVVASALAERLGASSFETIAHEALPESLADVDIAILPGALGVVENGAVALHGAEAQPRALAFLCQRLVLVLDAAMLVADMHEAIARAPGDALAWHHHTWVSGPSKTADIEQTLVLGAHGPRELAVIAVGRDD